MRWAAFMAVMAGAALTATGAAAQGNVGFAVGDLHATHEVLQKRAQTTSMLTAPASPFSQLSKTTRAWIREETKRQGENPRSVTEVLMAVDATLEEDAAELSRRHHVDPLDITRVVTLLIMADAEDDAGKAARRARKSGDPQLREAADQRLADATARRKEAFAIQSDVSLALATM